MAVLGAAACGRDGTGPTTGGGDVALDAGHFALYAGTEVRGELRFPAAAAAGAQYLVVAQSATGTPGLATAFRLTGVVGAAAVVPSAPAPQFAAPASASLALRFHDRLRARESALVTSARAAGLPLAAAPSRMPAAPPVVGSRRSFKVCGNLDCDTLKTVVATARYVGSHAAIYTDDTIPSGGGLSTSDLQAMGVQFDQQLYVIAQSAFGAESDVDTNGVIVILLTPKVNALVGRPDCDDSFITGYFFGADLTPTVRTQYNNGEVFYGMMPDPGSATLCSYTTALVRRLLPVTFIHEFQHMISFNQHVLLRGGDTEVMWLNEALSHVAEELGGRYYDSLGVDTTASRFYVGNLYNAYLYLSDPLASAVVTEEPPGELPERGALWLLLRYAIDREGPTLTRSLVGTSLLGEANVAAATGLPFATLLGHWALAVYASDFPGFSPPSELQYARWRFRTTFADLHAQLPSDFARTYPLLPTAATGGAVSLTGTVRSGSGAYVLVTQSANGAAFAVTFAPTTGGGFVADVGAQVAVVRLR